MDNVDRKKMSRMTSVGNGTQYLRLEGNNTWTITDKEQTYIFYNVDIGYDVSMLDAKLCPINGADRNAMIASLEDGIERHRKFLIEYGNRPNWKSTVEVKDARRGIKRMEREIARLGKLEFPQ